MKPPDLSPNAQRIHDHVLETILASRLGFATYANLGGHQTLCLTTPGRDLTPDLALCDRESFIVRHLVEVETTESITDAQAEKWAAEAHGPWRLWILVPQNATAKAAELCRQRGTPARIGSWSERPDGVTIQWPERAPIARER